VLKNFKLKNQKLALYQKSFLGEKIFRIVFGRKKNIFGAKNFLSKKNDLISPIFWPKK